MESDNLKTFKMVERVSCEQDGKINSTGKQNKQNLNVERHRLFTKYQRTWSTDIRCLLKHQY